MSLSGSPPFATGLGPQPQSWFSRRLPRARSLKPAGTTTRSRPPPIRLLWSYAISLEGASKPASVPDGSAAAFQSPYVQPPSRGSDLRHSRTPAYGASPTSALGGRPRILNLQECSILAAVRKVRFLESPSAVTFVSGIPSKTDIQRRVHFRCWYCPGPERPGS